MTSLSDKVKEKGDLPVFPEIIGHIIKKMNDPDCDIVDLARLIKTEPSLVGRIMTISNSAFYSAGQARITDVVVATVRLGLNEIRNVIYSAALMKMFERVTTIDQMMFWRHSLSVAFCAQSLSRIVKEDIIWQEAAYMAGLMHDIGIMVFVYLAPENYSDFIARITRSDYPHNFAQLVHLEMESFGIDHAHLGAAYLKEWWPVGEPVVLAVKNHHPEVASPPALSFLTKIVIAADKFCHSQGVHNGISVYKDPFTHDCFKPLDMSEEQIEKFIDQGTINIETSNLILSS